MKRTAILLLVVFNCLTCTCQEITQRLILTDTKDRLFINVYQPAFDAAGNYCFKVNQNGKDYFVTNSGKLGESKFIGSTYGNGGEIQYTNSYKDSMDKPWYYKNLHATKVLGPVTGKLDRYMTSGTRSSIAITTRYADTICFYVNGQLVSKNVMANLDRFVVDNYDWCAFSENGNSIYYIKEDSLYHLFVNGKMIDSSVNSFSELHINDKGYYVYAEGRRPVIKTDGYDYMFYVHTKDAAVGPVRTVWNNDLTESNSWYYSGDDNGPAYILINGTLQKGIKDVSNVTFAGKGGYLYTYNEDGAAKINVNGNVLPCPVPEILLPGINKDGDFSFYGIKDYYLYKFINGKQVETPISKYNVRATPLYISPKGESIHTFVTDDSIYLYRDDKLLFKPITKKSNFKVTPDDDLFSTSFVRGKAGNGNSLFYLKYNGIGYLVYNGAFSKPMIPIKEESDADKPAKGEVVGGSCSDFGFFAVQKIGNSKFQVNINNNLYKVLNADGIFKDSFIFSEKELIFYGVKGLSIYQYKLSY